MNNNTLLNDLTVDDFLAILSGLSEAVALSDMHGRVIWVSKSLCEALNISQEEWMGKTTKELIEEGSLERSLAKIRNAETQKGIVLTKNGKEFMSIVRPIYDREHNIKFYLSTSTLLEELSELKYHLEKLRRENKRFHGEIQLLREMILMENELVFESAEMKSLINYVAKVAPFDTTVLITGESGVGKEVLAKMLHFTSPRKNGPFIPVVIPSIPANLLEAELFGYSEGAFTGAARGGKTGLIELSHGGTLFLDEIGDCPYDIQVKLLRTLETNEIRRVGNANTIKLDIRIVAATNKNLKQMVENGQFREDLFYRLNVLPLHIQPLRERPQDIEPLCDFFIDKLNNKYNLKKHLSRKGLEKLLNYKWPGNVRELRNVMERLLILSEDDLITIEDINTIFGNSEDKMPKSMNSNQSADESIWNKYESYEQSRILEVLKQVGGNKTKAAQILGISRTKLYQKLRD